MHRSLIHGLGSALAIWSLLACAGPQAPAPEKQAEAIQALLARGPDFLTQRPGLEKLLNKFYAPADAQAPRAPVWVKNAQVSDPARALLRALRQSGEHGLNPADYRAGQLGERVNALGQQRQASAAQNAPAPQDSPAFALQFRDDVIPYRVFGVYVMPGETVSLKAVFTRGKGRIDMQADTGALTQTSDETWRWTAPDEPGHTRLLAKARDSDDRILLNVFVKTPLDSSDESLNGYRIGRYEQKALRGNAVYAPPQGLVEVTEENADIRVAPHFTLGQFLCHQQDGPPRYLLLRERLLLKLELILEQLRAAGHPVETLFIMSGYRTPWYNRAIGNTTRYSRHLYGGAADIFVDIDQDGVMDDLNGDGVSNRNDAEWLADLVRDKTNAPWYRPFIGGLGVYGPAPHRGAFVHVDVRGYKARW